MKLAPPSALALACVLALVCGLTARGATSKAGPSVDVPGIEPFAVRLGKTLWPYPLMSAFVSPGDELRIEIVAKNPSTAFTAEADGGTLAPLAGRAWTWRAPPESGHYDLRIRDSTSGETRTLRAFVLVPLPTGDRIGGYRFGAYPSVPLRGNPAYKVPAGLVELRGPADLTLAVSPHFRLGQFLCKQAGGFPKYLALQAPLLLNLEQLLEQLAKTGIAASTLHVMSGFRTPYYNAAIGNDTIYSRHVYGDAADVFVDRDGNDLMDDLNGDGKIDTDDARVLLTIADRLQRNSPKAFAIGGLGLYGTTGSHGPFLHVDTRGYSARW